MVKFWFLFGKVRNIEEQYQLITMGICNDSLLNLQIDLFFYSTMILKIDQSDIHWLHVIKFHQILLILQI